jgi:hypothetical protein
MDNELNHKEKELYKRVDEVLHYVWDPIGIHNCPEARDEYYTYIPQVFSMLKNSKTKKEISTHLINLAKVQIGLDPDINTIDKVVDLLIEWKELLLNKNL